MGRSWNEAHLLQTNAPEEVIETCKQDIYKDFAGEHTAGDMIASLLALGYTAVEIPFSIIGY